MSWSELFKNSGLLKMTVCDSKGNIMYYGEKQEEKK